MKIEKLNNANLNPRPGIIIDAEYELFNNIFNKINELIDAFTEEHRTNYDKIERLMEKIAKLERKEKEPEILPCPFCLGDAEILSGYQEYYVSCRDDECIASHYYQYMNHSFDTEQEAISAWNTRGKV